MIWFSIYCEKITTRSVATIHHLTVTNLFLVWWDLWKTSLLAPFKHTVWDWSHSSPCCALHPWGLLISELGFVPSDHPHLLRPPPMPHLWQPLVCSLYLCVFLKRKLHILSDHTVFVFLWLTSLSLTSLSSIHVVANWQDCLHFYDWTIFYCIHVHFLYPFALSADPQIASMPWLL